MILRSILVALALSTVAFLAVGSEAQLPPPAGGPGFRIYVLSPVLPPTVSFVSVGAGIEPMISLQAPRMQNLFSCFAPPAVPVALGPAPLPPILPTQELVVGLTNPFGTFKTGPAAANPDGVVHAVVQEQGLAMGQRTVRVAFEDLPGGGDLDFDDCVVSVTGFLKVCPPAAATLVQCLP